jgi:cytochrome c peroxidase
MRPSAGFVKAYMHNGYLKSLQDVVHFYNTSQSLPRCAQGSPGEKVSCWPAPEVAQNISPLVGNLGLTSQQEADIVAFLQTLTDRVSSAAESFVQRPPGGTTTPRKR